MSKIHIEFQDNSHGGRAETVCYDNADKLNVIDQNDAERRVQSVAALQMPAPRNERLYGCKDRSSDERYG